MKTCPICKSEFNDVTETCSWACTEKFISEKKNITRPVPSARKHSLMEKITIGIISAIALVTVILGWYSIRLDKNEPYKPMIAAHKPTVISEPSDDQVIYCADRFAKKAISFAVKDPESIKFLDKKAEQYYPNQKTYVCKWLITATNSYGARVQAFGVSSVRYKGGNVTEPNNWDVNFARIIEQ